MADRPHIEEIEEQAALHALGVLPPDEAHQFEQRLAAGCPLCTALTREFNETAAMLVLEAPDIMPSAGLRSRLLTSIGVPPPAKPSAPTEMGEGLIVRGGETPWEQTPIKGLEVRHLYGDTTLLVRMAPKTKYPGHPHPAAEQCLVLEGSVSSAGVTAYAGDFTYMPAGSKHGELYSETGCLLLIAYT